MRSTTIPAAADHAHTAAFHRPPRSTCAWLPARLLPDGAGHGPAAAPSGPAAPAAPPAASPAAATGAPAAPPAPPQEQQRPDGVTEQEWAALGDPGKSALIRERARAAAAERDLAALRSQRTGKPTAPGAPAAPAAQAPGAPAAPGQGSDPSDIAALVQQAVAAAIAPLQQANEEREATRAAELVREAVMNAATGRFLDPTDALVQVDLASLTDGTGRADQAKVTAALDALLLRKPHLGKVADDRRQPAGAPLGATGSSGPAALDDRVKATLARMQAAAGVQFAPGS